MADIFPVDPLSTRLRTQAGHDILYAIGTEQYIAVLALIEHDHAHALAAEVLALRDRLVAAAVAHPLNRSAISDSI